MVAERKQTFWDVRITGSKDRRIVGLWANFTPLRRDEAERLAETERANGYEVEIVPTRNDLWERTYGDK